MDFAFILKKIILSMIMPLSLGLILALIGLILLYKNNYKNGIPIKDTIINSKPKDTKEEVIKIKQLLGKKPFILVTSAYHMPRAMLLFKKEMAWHEYIGLLWSNLRGQI